jgi:lipopolysaccharide export system protein LptA
MKRIRWRFVLSAVLAGLGVAPFAPAQQTRFFDAAGRSPGSAPLVIECDRILDANLTAQQTTWRGNVRVFDPQFDLYCEVLTVRFTTNRNNDAVAAAGRGTNTARIQGIVAETNVFLVTKDLMAFGDRAVYTATNEALVLHGNPAMVGTEQGSVVSAMIVFERRADGVHLSAPSTNTTTLEGAGPGNFLNEAIRTNRPAPATPARTQP